MKQFNVTGMSCAACSARVEKAVSKVPGVTSCSVSLLTNSMGVDGSASAAEIIKAVEQAGYGASPHEKPGAAAPAAQSGKQGGLSAAQEAYRGMKRSYAKRTYLNVMNAPMLAELKEKGEIQGEIRLPVTLVERDSTRKRGK